MAAQPRKALVLTAVCLGQFMIQLDVDLTIVNVALPSIGQDLGASVSGLQWVIDGYSLALPVCCCSAGASATDPGTNASTWPAW